MAYCTNAEVETILGLEAGTLTTAQDTMITAFIVLVDDLIDQYTDSKLAGTEAGLAELFAAAVAHIYQNGIAKFWNPIWRCLFKKQCQNLLKHKDYERTVYIGDIVDVFDQDED